MSDSPSSLNMSLSLAICNTSDILKTQTIIYFYNLTFQKNYTVVRNKEMLKVYNPLEKCFWLATVKIPGLGNISLKKAQ